MTGTPPSAEDTPERVSLGTAEPPASPADAATEAQKAPSADGFAELWRHIHEHKVIQWGLAYLGAALALAHGQELMAHAFHWPEVVARVVMGVLVAGFPVALVLAWYHGHRGLKSFSPAEMTIVAMLMLIGAGGLIVLVRPSAEHAPAQPAASAERTAASTEPQPEAGATQEARATTIKEIAALVQKDFYGQAFTLARTLIGTAQAKEDPELANL